MSQPRPGKRPRSNASIEGSTIFVPTNNQTSRSGDESSSSPSSSLIVMLAKGCKKHREQHEKEGDIHLLSDETQIPGSCVKALSSLSRILPKVEQAYCASSTPKPGDIENLCDFYLSVVQRNFCPAALKLFDHGRKPVEILSKVILLLEHVVSESNQNQFRKQWRRANKKESDESSFLTLLDRLALTAASLLGVVAEQSLHPCIFQDLVNTSYDLSVLSDSKCFHSGEEQQQTVEILLFSETLAGVGENSELIVRVDSAEAAQVLQSTMLKMLLHWVTIRRSKRLETFPDPLQIGFQPDSRFAPYLWTGGRVDFSNHETATEFRATILDAIQTTIDSSRFYDEIRCQAGCSLVQAILHDFFSSGLPYLDWILELLMTIAQLTLELLQKHRETRGADALAACLEECLDITPSVDGWTCFSVHRTLRRALCPILLECVPFIPINPLRSARLGTVILRFLGSSLSQSSTDLSLPLQNYAVATDPEFLEALFNLIASPTFCRNSVWICALAMDCLVKKCGASDWDNVVDRIVTKREPGQTYLSELAQTRKQPVRTSPAQMIDTPTKKARLEMGAYLVSSEHRIDLVKNRIINLFSQALVLCHDIESGETTTDPDVFMTGFVAISSSIRLICFTQCLQDDSRFAIILEDLVSFLKKSSFADFSPEVLRNEVMKQLAAELLAKKDCIRLDPLHSNELLDWARWSSHLALNECRNSFPPGLLIPLNSDTKCQLSRIRLLRQKLAKSPQLNMTSNEPLQHTLDVLSDAFFHHSDPIVRLLYWQISGWLLLSSPDLQEHLGLTRDTQDLGASKLVKFVVSTPFSDENDQVRAYTSREVCTIVVSNRALTEYLVANNENKVVGWNSETIADFGGGLDQTRLFKDIDSLLHHHCRIPQSQLSFTVGLTLGSNSDDELAKLHEKISLQRSGIRCLIFLFESFLKLGCPVGQLMAKNSFLRVIRLWVFFGQNQGSETSSYAFGELCRVWSRVKGLIDAKFLLQVAPASFRDILFPSSAFFTYAEQTSTNPLLGHLEQQCRLLYTMIEKFFCRGDFTNFAVLAGASVDDVEESLNFCLPNAQVQLIMEKDFDCLRSLTAFTRFVFSRRLAIKRSNKGDQIATPGSDVDLLTWENSTKSGLWARDLETQTMELCSRSDIIERLLPLVLMHGGPDEDRFFTTRVLLNKLSIPKMLSMRGQLILKRLIMEFGESDEVPKQAAWALKRAAVAKGLSQRETTLVSISTGTPDSNDEAVASWVSESFMHLLVNVVQRNWREKTVLDRICALRCLRAMLGFLKTVGSSQFLPQVMSTVNASLGDLDSDSLEESSEISYVAVQIMDLMVRHAWEDNADAIGEHLTSIVVALIPVFSQEAGFDRIYSKRGYGRKTVLLAASLLKWLAEGTRGRKLATFFKNIPFLPPIPELDPVRSSLAELGVDFEELRISMTDASSSRLSTQSDLASMSGDSKSIERLRRMKTHLQQRLRTLCSLLGNENSSIRLHAVLHLVSLLESTRGLFHVLVETEDTSSITRFVTVCTNKSLTDGRGTVSTLIETLLCRCAHETNQRIRNLLGKAFGEVGAIAKHRIEPHGSNEGNRKDSETSYSWRLARPPWKVDPADYQVCLLTDHLVTALKAAPTSVDHHKIAFTIQEMLALARLPIDTILAAKNDETSHEIPEWLRSKLESAGVVPVVEPFMNSEFREKEPSNPSPPPFFSRSSSYYDWISSWSRFMIHRSKRRNDSSWGRLLHACRFALRTRSGLAITEFLLPIVILDRMCFGNLEDEQCVLSEIKSALTFESSRSDESKDLMNQAERQKVVAALFGTLDTLRYWSEKDCEDRHRVSTSSNTTSNEKTTDEFSGYWSADESVMRIEDILRAVPMSLQAMAAANAGMYSRSLRLLEMDSRNTVVDQVFNNTSRGQVRSTRSVSAGHCPSASIDLLKDNLATLGEYEAVAALAEDDFAADAMSKALDGIRQKESSGDRSGALQDYERAYQLTKDPQQGESLMHGTLKCLLELGQFESVLRQVQGLSSTSVGKASSPMVPFAAEAAWRLGRWDTLSELVCQGNGQESTSPSDGYLEVEVGQAMLALHRKDEPSVLTAIDRARELVMIQLSNSARESFSRAYSHIVNLHALRELEDATQIICKDTAESDLGTYVDTGGGFWMKRLDLADPSCAMTLIQSRLALARLAGNPGLEASLFSAIGRRARKDKQYGIAASALAQAEASFDRVKDDSLLAAHRSDLLIQLAKLKHETGETTASLRLLNMDDIESMSEMDSQSLESQILQRSESVLHTGMLSIESAIEHFKKCALISTRWMVEGGVKDCTTMIQRFKVIHKVAPKWEKVHFQFAKYVESVMHSRIEALQRRSRGQFSTEEDSFRTTCLAQDKHCQKYLLLAVKHFVEALTLDLKHLFQALPRLLSLWFDFSSVSIETGSAEPMSQDTLVSMSNHLRAKQTEMTEFVAGKHRAIPAHAFYSALPQLISRTMDQSGDLSIVIQGILTRVLSKFPGQAMWPLAWLRHSKDAKRRSVGEDIFKEATNQLKKSSHTESMHKLLVASKGLFVFLHDLAKYKASEGKRSVNVRPWTGEVPLSEFTPPVQAALSPTFSWLEGRRSQDAFPRQLPRMKEFSRNVTVMMSKAKPKKLKAIAVAMQSNPRTKSSSSEVVGEFHFLVKQEAKGDLRKDARVQDLNSVINRLWMSSQNNPGKSGPRRRLRLRTFAVTCLSEDTGILEWVPKTNSLRNLVTDSYNPQASPFSSKRRGRRMANAGDPMLRANFEKKCQEMYFVSGDLKKAAILFDDLCLKANPPLLYWWFVHKYQDPHQWYEARTQFTLSAAAWSAVGHVIGLGDRHSENILVDTTNGEMVHVDFDCIFDKGLNLPKPEVVPFRLTANMIDAFGPVGADGIYTSSLRDAMRTLRSNRDTLLSVLEPFVKDPVIDWKRSRTQQKSATEQQERQTREAKRSIKVIDERLQGVYNLRNPNMKKIRRTDLRSNEDVDAMAHLLPLPVEGQVHRMIAEATSHENLVQLYVGWMPWV